MSPQLTVVRVADDAQAWEQAGFAVRPAAGDTHSGDGALSTVAIGPVAIELSGTTSGSGARGATSLSFDTDVAPSSDGAAELDGIALGAARPSPSQPTPHPNGVTGLDHVVLNTPHLARTLDAFGAIGIEPRRTRHVEMGERSFDQTFLWMGRTICEVISKPGETGDGPSSIWGLAFVAVDLDHTVASLGAGISAARDAVQPNRRIASLRHDALGISLPVAVMTPHV